MDPPPDGSGSPATGGAGEGGLDPELLAATEMAQALAAEQATGPLDGAGPDAGGGGADDHGWEECADDEGNTYYYNAKSGDSQWERPAAMRLKALVHTGLWRGYAGDGSAGDGSAGDASAGDASASHGDEWEECYDAESGATYFYNSRSGESAWERPAAMRLRALVNTGMWQGYVDGTAAEEPPAQEGADGDEWEECDDGEGNSYFYNARTGESAWEKPAARKLKALVHTGMWQGLVANGSAEEGAAYDWAADAQGAEADEAGEWGTKEDHWEECDDGEGNTYYYNAKSGESSWEKPAARKLKALVNTGLWKGLADDHESQRTTDALPEGWHAYHDVEGNPYYYNEATEETSWERPAG
jgi:hypothetical protein